MIGDKKLYKKAIVFLRKAYAKPQYSVKATQWSSYVTTYNNELLQVLAIPGSNDVWDWFWNILLIQRDGVKYGCWVSAKRILSTFIKKPNMKLLITCHSKSGGTGIYLQEILGAEYCIAFEPARSFIDEKENKNTLTFKDPDDIVPKVGWSRFKHRITDTVLLPKDKKWWDLKGKIEDHFTSHAEQFIDQMED